MTLSKNALVPTWMLYLDHVPEIHTSLSEMPHNLSSPLGDEGDPW